MPFIKLRVQAICRWDFTKLSNYCKDIEKVLEQVVVISSETKKFITTYLSKLLKAGCAITFSTSKTAFLLFEKFWLCVEFSCLRYFLLQIEHIFLAGKMSLSEIDLKFSKLITWSTVITVSPYPARVRPILGYQIDRTGLENCSKCALVITILHIVNLPHSTRVL